MFTRDKCSPCVDAMPPLSHHLPIWLSCFVLCRCPRTMNEFVLERQRTFFPISRFQPLQFWSRVFLRTFSCTLGNSFSSLAFSVIAFSACPFDLFIHWQKYRLIVSICDYPLSTYDGCNLTAIRESKFMSMRKCDTIRKEITKYIKSRYCQSQNFYGGPK